MFGVIFLLIFVNDMIQQMPDGSYKLFKVFFVYPFFEKYFVACYSGSQREPLSLIIYYEASLFDGLAILKDELHGFLLFLNGCFKKVIVNCHNYLPLFGVFYFLFVVGLTVIVVSWFWRFVLSRTVFAVCMLCILCFLLTSYLIQLFAYRRFVITLNCTLGGSRSAL